MDNTETLRKIDMLSAIALITGASSGNLEGLERLLATGVDVNLQLPGAPTALMAAASNGHIDTVRFLLDKGANVNAVGDGGQTALNLASSRGHVTIVELLQAIVNNPEKMISELESCKNSIMVCIASCPEKFIFPPNGLVKFASGAILSHEYIKNELSKYKIGIIGQIEALRTGKYHGMTISKAQLRSGLTTMIAELDKELDAWFTYSITGSGIEELMDVSRKLKEILHLSIEANV